MIKHIAYVKYVLFSIIFFCSFLSAKLYSNPAAEVSSYIKSLDDFLVSQHLLQSNEKRLAQLEFTFVETNKNTLNSQEIEPFINIIKIEDVAVIKVFNLPLSDGKIKINSNIEQILMRAYLFSEALVTENKIDDIWDQPNKYELDIPDVIILGLLALRNITKLETKVLFMNKYRFQQKKLKLQDFQLNFDENIEAQNMSNPALILSALSFIGTWKSWLANSHTYPNWHEIVKFRGDWKDYFKSQLPDAQKWIDTPSQWLEFHLLDILTRQPYDKLTLEQSKTALEEIWQQSNPLWVDIGKAITNQDLKLISYLKKEIIALQRIINPYYYPLIKDFKNLLLQKWFKSQPLENNNDEARGSFITGVNESEKSKNLNSIKENSNMKQGEFEPSNELTQKLQKIHQNFEQKLAEKHLKSRVISEFLSQETLENDFMRDDKKKASNKSPILYKKDPVSDYLNLYN